MSNIAENIANLREEIENSLSVSHRNGDSVEILCASKHRTIQELLEVKSCGIDVFGENIVQEFVSKYDDRLTWDIIGQLQTNKVKYVVGKVRLIQSLDRISLAEEVQKVASKRGIIQKCLVEINTGAEEAKGGILLPEVESFVTQMQEYPAIQLVGLMAVAPKADESTLRGLFSGVTEEFYRIKSKNPYFQYISMGMSADYKLAVECGANLIRPGKIIFS